jgi:hypothetical protein
MREHGHKSGSIKDMYRKNIALLLLFCLTMPAWSQDTNSVQSAATTTPTPETIGILLKNNNWSIDELNRRALELLWSRSDMPRNKKFQAVVYITPQDKDTMCEFTYSKGFDQPVWTVRIGYDGKVKDFKKSIKREGVPSLEIPPIPKSTKAPSGGRQ